METIHILRITNFLIPFAWLTAILFYRLKQKDVKQEWVKFGIATTVLSLVLLGLYSTLTTYSLWKNDPLSKYLLPPYQETYFYRYSFFHFWLSSVLAVTVSLMWSGFLLALNKYSSNRLLDRKEVWLGFFTAMVAGWPGFVPYLIILFAILLVIQTINTFILKNQNRVVVSHAMILSSIIVLLYGKLFIEKLNLDILAI